MLKLDQSRLSAAEVCTSLIAGDIEQFNERLACDGIDWAYLLYFCDVNGLFGLINSEISDLDDDRVPMRVAAMIKREGERHAKRWHALASMLDLLVASRASGIPPILLKGAALKATIYKDDPTKRQLGDVDILISSENADHYCSTLEGCGYKLRKGKNGYTAISLHPTAGRLVIDVHIDDTSKTNRNPKLVYKIFQASLLPPNGDTLGYRIPSSEMMFLHGCKHFCEHMDDFRKVLVQDDIRLFRLVDLLLLAPVVKRNLTLDLAEQLGWMGELERVVSYLRCFTNTLGDWPSATLSNENIQTPAGTFSWPWPFSERMLRLDRDSWLSKRMQQDGRRSNWYSSANGALHTKEA